MPRRTLLSADQRARLFGIPTDRAEMARHYVLGAADLALIRSKRRAANRLGFAVQLCLLRHPGGGLEPGGHPPGAVLAFVAEQLGTPPSSFAGYAARDQTRREHAAELQSVLGLRSFRLADWRACLGVGAEAAWATDRGEPIVAAMLGHLRAAVVVVPGAAVLERIGLAARARARRQAFARLAEGMDDAERAALGGMLAPDPALRGRSRFTWLRDAPEAPGPANIAALLDRLDWIRCVDAGRAARIHPARLARLVEEGGIMTAQHLAGVEPDRRTALLVAQVADLRTRLADATLAMFCKYMGSLFTKARNRDDRRFQATRRDVARTLVLFRRTIAALHRARETGEEGVAVVEREVGMARLEGALPVIDAAAGVAEPETLVTAAERYAVLRRFAPRFLAAFEFRSGTPRDPLLAALELLRALDRDGARALPRRPPAAFLPRSGGPWSSRARRRTGACTRRRRWPSCATDCGAPTCGSRVPATTAPSRTTCCRQRQRQQQPCPPSAARPIPSATSPPAPPCCTSAWPQSRTSPAAARWTGSRSRTARSSSRGPSRPSRTRRASSRTDSTAWCPGCA